MSCKWFGRGALRWCSRHFQPLEWVYCLKEVAAPDKPSEPGEKICEVVWKADIVICKESKSFLWMCLRAVKSRGWGELGCCRFCNWDHVVTSKTVVFACHLGLDVQAWFIFCADLSFKMTPDHGYFQNFLWCGVSKSPTRTVVIIFIGIQRRQTSKALSCLKPHPTKFFPVSAWTSKSAQRINHTSCHPRWCLTSQRQLTHCSRQEQCRLPST